MSRTQVSYFHVRIHEKPYPRIEIFELFFFRVEIFEFLRILENDLRFSLCATITICESRNFEFSTRRQGYSSYVSFSMHVQAIENRFSNFREEPYVSFSA